MPDVVPLLYALAQSHRHLQTTFVVVCSYLPFCMSSFLFAGTEGDRGRKRYEEETGRERGECERERVWGMSF